MTETHSLPLVIPPEHPALAGHFPGRPVVPGVVLLERVAGAWRAWRGVVVAGLDVKFLRPLLPGEHATITLVGDAHRVRFEVTRDDGAAVARGTLAAARVPACGATPPAEAC